MNKIKDKLALMAPSAVFAEGEPLTVTVPAGEFHAVAKSLRDDPEMRFDFLVCMTGMDWGETLGVVYHLRSTEFGHEIVLRTETSDRENPELQSVCDLWEAAHLNEREVYDFTGFVLSVIPICVVSICETIGWGTRSGKIMTPRRRSIPFGWRAMSRSMLCRDCRRRTERSKRRRAYCSTIRNMWSI